MVSQNVPLIESGRVDCYLILEPQCQMCITQHQDALQRLFEREGVSRLFRRSGRSCPGKRVCIELSFIHTSIRVPSCRSQIRLD